MTLDELINVLNHTSYDFNLMALEYLPGSERIKQIIIYFIILYKLKINFKVYHLYIILTQLFI